MTNKSYKILMSYDDYDSRINYLTLLSKIGYETFGSARHINQSFYKSYEWKQIRNSIIVRDNGCDLGLKEFPISSRIIIHHINPIDEYDLINMTDKVIDPNNLICCTHRTHNLIHFGSANGDTQSLSMFRKPNDTKLW